MARQAGRNVAKSATAKTTPAAPPGEDHAGSAAEDHRVRGVNAQQHTADGPKEHEQRRPKLSVQRKDGPKGCPPAGVGIRIPALQVSGKVVHLRLCLGRCNAWDPVLGQFEHFEHRVGVDLPFRRLTSEVLPTLRRELIELGAPVVVGEAPL